MYVTSTACHVYIILDTTIVDKIPVYPTILGELASDGRQR